MLSEFIRSNLRLFPDEQFHPMLVLHHDTHIRYILDNLQAIIQNTFGEDPA